MLLSGDEQRRAMGSGLAICREEHGFQLPGFNSPSCSTIVAAKAAERMPAALIFSSG